LATGRQIPGPGRKNLPRKGIGEAAEFPTGKDYFRKAERMKGKNEQIELEGVRTKTGLGLPSTTV